MFRQRKLQLEPRRVSKRKRRFARAGFGPPMEMFHFLKIFIFFLQIPSYADLAQIVSDGSFNYQTMLNIGNERNVKFHVSILAQSAVFVIFYDDQWPNKPGYILSLDANDAKKVEFRYCQQILKGAAPFGCEQSVSKVSHSQSVFFV